MPVEIRRHYPGEDLKPFISAAHEVFRGDPAWVAPLQMEIRDRLTPAKNPFFQHAEVTIFTAWRGDRVVGRCTAQIDHEHLKTHRDGAGFFGFMDTIDDQAVATALLAEAEAWLRDRGMKVARGPLSLNINEEAGTLVEGFDMPPMMMMTHSRPWQGDLIEGAGYQKAKDLLAWRYEVGTPHRRADRAWKAISAMPEVRFRSLSKKNLESDVRVMLDIFNDAWSENWGFVKATDAEAKKMAKDIALVLDEDLAFFADIDGKPMGLCVTMPNLNEALHGLDGRLAPIGIFKLLYRLKVKRPKTARLILLGIRQEIRGIKRYGGLSLAMYVEVSKRGAEKGIEWGELSWTLEDNHPINLGIRAMGAKVYKKYRIYEKPL
jgi:GNAT superfamily N-acetyltransferase